MKKQNCTNTMLCWNPKGNVALISGQENTKMFTHQLKAGTRRSNLAVSVVAMLLIHRDGCDSNKVNAALREMEEFWDDLPDEQKGNRQNTRK